MRKGCSRRLSFILAAIFLAAAAAGSAQSSGRLVEGKTPDTAADPALVAFFEAVRSGRVEDVRSLLDRGVDKDASLGGEYALLEAVRSGQAAVLALLLDRGCLTEVYSARKTTPLYEAVAAGNPELVALLLDHGADPWVLAEGFMGLLEAAASKGDVESIRILISRHPALMAYRGGSALLRACWAGRPGSVRFLLNAGADTGVVGPYGSGPLAAAVAGKSKEVVELLLNRGMAVNVPGREGGSLLIYAAQGGDASIVSLLLEHGADPSGKGEGGRTALHAAALKGDPDTVSVLIDAGVDLSTQDFRGMTPLMMAAERGHRKAVQLFLKAGAPVDAVSMTGLTALHLAVRGKSPNVALDLLAAGAEPGRKGRTGNGVLETAVRPGGETMVNALLTFRPSSFGQEDFDRGLLQASRQGMADLIPVFLKAGARTESRWGSALTQAVRHPGAVKALLKAGADPMADNPSHQTPLQEAARQDATKSLRLILGSGGTPNHVDLQGRTPLHYAAERCNAVAVDALLKAGADETVKDNGGKTAGDTARAKGCSDVIALIEALPPGREELNVALLKAAAEGDSARIRSLLDQGANVNTHDKGGRNTPLMKAIRHPEAVALLLERGADPFLHPPSRVRGAAPRSPLRLAMRDGSENVVRDLVPRIKNPRYLGQHLAVIYGDRPALTRILVEGGALLDMEDPQKRTPLQVAAQLGFSKVASVLIQAGSDVHQPGLLHSASSRGSLDLVRLLLEKGVDPDTKDRDGYTPLMVAVSRSFRKAGRIEVVQALLEAGADIEATNVKGETPLMRAALQYVRSGETAALEAVKLLIDHGSDPSVTDASGKTILSLAREYNSRISPQRDLVPLEDLLSSRDGR